MRPETLLLSGMITVLIGIILWRFAWEITKTSDKSIGFLLRLKWVSILLYFAGAGTLLLGVNGLDPKTIAAIAIWAFAASLLLLIPGILLAVRHHLQYGAQWNGYLGWALVGIGSIYASYFGWYLFIR